jgi:hypothetical protein
MQSQRKLLSMLIIVVLMLMAFSAVAYAAPSFQQEAPLVDNDQDGLDATRDPNDNNVDTDGDGLCDGPGNAPGCLAYNPAGGGEDVNADGVQQPQETNNTRVDTDGDNLCDGPSASSGFAPGCLAAFGAGRGGEDKDRDGTVDPAPETDPRRIDTDGDRLPDGWIDGWCFNRLTGANAGVNCPVDGVRQRFEGEDLNLNGIYDLGNNETNPRVVDTDGDGMPDWYEAANLCLSPEVNDANGDNDFDSFPDLAATPRLTNIEEYQQQMDACNTDTDGDGMTDDWEFAFSAANNQNFCPDLNANGVGDGVMLPTVDDKAADPDKDGASSLMEYKGIDKTSPFVPFTANLTTNPSQDWTSPCNANSDTDDLNLDGVINPQFEVDRGPVGIQAADNFIDGYEYWSRAYPSSMVLCTGTQMHPKLGVDGDFADYDAETLDNILEYKGEDDVAPLANLTELFPGDLANTALPQWNSGDPWYRFQTTGPASDATNACVKDTDRGGVNDRLEYDTWDFNGWELKGNWKTDDGQADHDYDGLPSIVEDKNVDGVFNDLTNWLNPDTDYDALCDGNLGHVLQNPNGIYPSPLPATITLVSPPYGNPVRLSIQNVLGGPKMFDLDAPNPPGTLVDDYICGGGEDLDRNGQIAGDADNDRKWDVDEDLDNDGVLDGNENDGPAGVAPPDDGDGHLSTAVEGWTETDPARPDTDADGLCDGSANNQFAPAGQPAGCVRGEDISAAGLDNAVASERGVSETDPLDLDTDDDALNDYIEVVVMGGRNDCQAIVPASWPASIGGLGAGVYAGLHADADGDMLYDGFYDRNAVGLDVGAGVVGAQIQIGFIPWSGFDGPNNRLNDDADVLVVNDPDDDDQPGEDVERLVQGGVQPLGDGTWNHTFGNVTPIFQETNACAFDSEKDGIWDGTEYASYEAPKYNNPIPPNTNPWNSTKDLMDDTDIDMAPITMAAAKDWLRPALDVDSDGDMLCDGDITNSGNIGCRGPNNTLNDANGDWIDDDSISTALGAPSGLYWLIGEDVVEPQGTQGGIQDPTETWPMAWDTDGDRVDDGIEVVWFERFDCGNRIYRSDLNTWACDGGDRNALDTDSDSDGLPDGWIDFNNDGVRQANEGEDFDLTNALLGNDFNGHILGDVDGDRIWDVAMDDGGMPGGLVPDPETWSESDPLNYDTDGDHIWDGDEANAKTHATGACFSLWNADSDYDGLADGWFDYNGTGPAVWKGEGVTRVPGTFAIDPTLNPVRLDAIIAGDSGLMESGAQVAAYRQDGIVDYYETWLETNPCNPDTDSDGNRDYVEVWGWEAGYLISDTGWQEGTPYGQLDDGPRPTPDVDADGKFAAVDPNADGNNLYPNPGTGLPVGNYTYAGDSVCDSGLDFNAVAGPYYGKYRAFQRIAPGAAVIIEENNPNQTYREVCTLQSSTLISGPTNPVFNANQFGEDIGWYICDQNGCQVIGGDGVIGYGGFYAGNPIWNAFEAEDVWAPLWPYQNVLNPSTSPLAWNVYFWQSPGVPPQTGFDRSNWDYPDSFVPIGSTQEFVAVGDWDRDRIIDDNEDGAYMVPGCDDFPQCGAGGAITLVKLIEDWGETDPLNADTDGDGIVDEVEVYARYAGENQARPGLCTASTRWGPLTDDQDFDGALDGEEDVDLDGNYFSGLPLLVDYPWICPTGNPNSPACVLGAYAGTGTSPYAGPNSTGVETNVCGEDTDTDGLVDGYELHVSLTDPADTDSDDDGSPDEPPTAPACTAYDFNSDGVIDIQDIAAVASRWMDPTRYDVRYDVAPAGAPDGVIDIADIAAVAVRFGQTCP